MPMSIDFSINIGILLQTGLVIGGGLIGYGALRRMVNEMEIEMKEIKQDQKELMKTMAQIAVQDTRLDRVEEDIRDMRHGRGLIVEHFQKAIVRRDQSE